MEWRAKRNIENSILKYIRDNINADWSNVNTGLSFDYKENSLPFIAIRADSATHSKLELGSTTLNSKNLIIIDIYAKGDGQRLDLAEYLLDKLRGGFQYYIWQPNPADKENLLTTANGWVYVSIAGDVKIDLGENVGACDKFRHRITLELERNKK